MCQKPLLPSRLGHNFADLRFRHVTPDKFQVCHDLSPLCTFLPRGTREQADSSLKKRFGITTWGVEKACPERRRKVGL